MEASQQLQLDEEYKIKILYYMRIYYAYLKNFGMNYRQLLLELNKNNSRFPVVLQLFFEKLHNEYNITYLVNEIVYPNDVTYEEMYSLNERIKILYESILY